MKKYLLLIFFLAIHLNVFAQHGKYYFYPLSGRSVLSRTQGTNWLALQNSQPVEIVPGNMINVEGNGKGELHFPDGSMVRMKNSAMVTVQRYGINLRFGYVWLNITKSHDTFKVTTPLGSCEVLGTSFDVDVDRFGKSLIRVYEGIVAVKAGENLQGRQLVLQAGMQTKLNDSSKVAKKPDKFNSSSILATIKSEWEHRNFIDNNMPAIYQPAIPSDDKSKANRTQYVPTITQEGLPEIRPEIKEELHKLDATHSNLEEKKKSSNITSYKSLVRQRSEFQEMLFNRKLERESVIGGYTLKNNLKKQGHTSYFGEANSGNEGVYISEESEKEYENLRNRLQRVQSSIQQLEAQIQGLIAENSSTLSQRQRIAQNQSDLKSMKIEQRMLQSRMKAIENKGRMKK